MRWENAGHLALEKELIARAVGRKRQGAVELVGDFVGRIIVRIHCNREKNERLVRFVFDREPNGLNVLSGKIFSEALLTFTRSECARFHLESGSRLGLRASHEAGVATRVRAERE